MKFLNIESIHVGNIGMAIAIDLAISQKASQDSSIIITLNSDFHTILAASGDNKPSVIRIRTEGLKTDKLTGIIESILESFKKELQNGAAVQQQPFTH